MVFFFLKFLFFLSFGGFLGEFWWFYSAFLMILVRALGGLVRLLVRLLRSGDFVEPFWWYFF